MTDDNPGLRKVLDDIDALLPPGAPSSADELGMPDAMRWSPVEHTEHPTVAPPIGHVRRYRDLPPEHRLTPHQRLAAAALASPWLLHAAAIEEATRAAADMLTAPRHHHYDTIRPTTAYLADGANQTSITIDALNIANTITVTNPQRNQHNCNTPTDRAAAIIQARRHRNTGPSNPHGIDGRARRDQHPHRAPAPHARPGRPAATQVPATPRVVAIDDLSLSHWSGPWDVGWEVMVAFDPATSAFAMGGVVRRGSASVDIEPGGAEVAGVPYQASAAAAEWVAGAEFVVHRDTSYDGDASPLPPPQPGTG